MSKARNLNLSLKELIYIAVAINENTLENKIRLKDEKIPTDKFIRKFEINRKNFSETIKLTEINYNKSTFLYDVPGSIKGTEPVVNKGFNESETLVINKSVTKVSNIKDLGNTLIDKKNKNETSVFIKNIKEEVQEFSNIKTEINEMLEWYRNQKNIIDVEIPIIKVDSQKFKNEQAITRGVKLYLSAFNTFKDFCLENGQYKMQDLISMALIEYADKYK
jgi:hypothetical protein